MKKSRYTEEEIIGILKQHEAGVKTAELCREHGISAATFYGWKSKYGGMEVSEAQRWKAMEDGGDVALVSNDFRLSERTACKLLGMERSSYRYEPRPDRNMKLREALVKLARQKRGY